MQSEWYNRILFLIGNVSEGVKRNENICLEYLGKVMEGEISETFTGRVIALCDLKIGQNYLLVTRVLKDDYTTFQTLFM